ncbi:MAG: group II intron reverse transcriptase/maturase [Terracidiphilus sp.]
MTAAKPFTIPKGLVYEAFLAVKANAGSAGVDKETIADFERDLKGNLYRVWNRMSSGSYFPPPVRAVAIPKKTGGERILGVPTVADRVAQTVVKAVLEPLLEPIFLPDSYGYRPEKSALDAIAVTRERCWRYDWVLEFDIRGLFDNISHELLLRALEKHTDSEWVRLYVRRWLMAPLQLADGTLVERTKGTPQGGVVSPILANLFLHYTFDAWMARTFPGVPWCRYADDGLIHCKTETQALAVKAALAERFAQCGLEMHPDKTQIVYCKDQSRKGQYPTTKFDFLGYCFRPRVVKNRKRNTLFVSFTPAVSASALKTMRVKTRRLNYRNRTELSLDDIARLHNPVLRGWMAYYGRFCPSAMASVLEHFDKTLVAWAMRKFKRLKGHKIRACRFLEEIAKRQPNLFVHWRKRMATGLA